MRQLDSIGAVDLYLDEDSRDIVIAIKTELGTITAALTAERACQLGVSLVRESGKRYVIKREQPPVAASPPQQEEYDAKRSNGTSGRADPDSEPISLSGGPGWGHVPRRDIPGVQGGQPTGERPGDESGPKP